ncbi:Uncharacterized protein DAT39_021187 [Clarias magur]|uniref:Uncharacterized protein n=1 Tax=Clarias magur TaxID=1594786 RepID=A0A8J4X968_CLAMG|nr:Uncharacterized protein DAT39_021187 [Clarias magur]
MSLPRRLRMNQRFMSTTRFIHFTGSAQLREGGAWEGVGSLAILKRSSESFLTTFFAHNMYTVHGTE